MADIASPLLTTGQVARLCGVTPDAVLKWVKKGRLAASRTPGGHYRVCQASLESLGLIRSQAEESSAEASACRRPALHCWEYFTPQGGQSNACRECLVYRARIEKCYEVAGLGETIGHSRRFCKTKCQDCPFFRASQGLATAVLVITEDEEFARKLADQADAERLWFRFAKSAYESSALIEAFRPGVVLIDSALPEARDQRIAHSILNDERIPGARVVLALREGDQAAAAGPRVSTLPFPCTAKRIEGLVMSLARPADSLAQRPA
jgi:excisionase family DNA binding protein